MAVPVEPGQVVKGFISTWWASGQIRVPSRSPPTSAIARQVDAIGNLIQPEEIGPLFREQAALVLRHRPVNQMSARARPQGKGSSGPRFT